MIFFRLLALFCTFFALLPAKAATDSDVYLARKYLRCAAFYVSGSTTVTSAVVKRELQDHANVSLYSAELLMNGDRPRVKAEFESARERFFAELDSFEVKADPRGFLNFMGGYCNDLRRQHPVAFPEPPAAASASATSSAPAAAADTAK